MKRPLLPLALALAWLAALLAAGCDGTDSSQDSPEPVDARIPPEGHTRLTVPITGPPSVPFRVLHGQTVIREFGREELDSLRNHSFSDFTWEHPEILRAAEMAIETLAPDGWFRIDLAVEEHVTRCLTLRPSEYGAPLLELCVDNRGLGKTEVSIGLLVMEVASESAWKGGVPGLRGDQPVAVLLDGKEVGQVPPADRERVQAVLVDTSGRRGYRWRRFYYRGALLDGLPEPRRIPPAILRSRFVHELPGTVDDFLVESPESVELYEGETDIRSELVEWTGPVSWSAGPEYLGKVFVAFSPDSGVLASAQWERSTVRLWSVATSELIREIPLDAGFLHMAFSPGGEHLAIVTSGSARLVRLADPETTSVLLKRREDERVLGLVFSPDGKMLAGWRAWGAGVGVWDSSAGRLVREMDQTNGGAGGAVFSPDGALLAGLDRYRKLSAWAVADGRRVHEQEWELAEGETWLGWCFHLERRSLIAVTTDRIHEWDLATWKGREAVRFEKRKNDYEAYPFCDGLRFAIRSRELDRDIEVWDLTSFRLLAELSAPESLGQEVPAGGLAISPDGRYVAAGSKEGEIVLWPLDE